VSGLRIFSYLPNPRLAKATIAARLAGVSLEVRGAPPRELGDWLWDFDAHVLAEGEDVAGTRVHARTGFAGTLRKTEAFLDAHPFGTVPAAFSPDGKVGVFESNSILRAVARLAGPAHPLYGGGDPYAASRIDSFLDASLVFARDVQAYLLKLASGKIKRPMHERARGARDEYLAGIERALSGRSFLVGDRLTIADVAFAAELALFSAERAHARVLAEAELAPLWSDDLAAVHPRALGHFEKLAAHEAFAPDLGPYLAKLAAR
jgi:glutathione S-transferase